MAMPVVVTCVSCSAENPAGQRFCGECGSRLAASPEERRWATVVFADLSGFTTLSEQLDPEDVRDLVDRAFRQLRAVVEAYDGTVDRMLGDGMLVVFGAPIAHDDDAERAVRASVELHGCVERSPELFGGLGLSVGINTGEVMFAAAGSDRAGDLTVLGDVVNTASRLQSAAARGETLVGGETVRSCSDLVSFEDVGTVPAKGKSEPLRAWRVAAVERLQPRRSADPTPLVGREEDLAAMASLFARVRQERRPAVINLLGEPGVGKSRLARELLEAARSGDFPTGGGAGDVSGVAGDLAGAGGEDPLVFTGYCLPYGDALAYSAVAGALRQAAGVEADDSAAAARSKLRQLVARATAPNPLLDEQLVEHLSLLAGLARDGFEAPVQQDRLRISLRRFLEAAAARRPLCLTLEDVHWADDSLLDLVEYVASKVSDVPLLVLTTARPELVDRRPSWGSGFANLLTIRLGPLSGEAAERLALEVCRSRDLPEAEAPAIAAVAEGNPLFAEELGGMLAEHGGEGGAALPGSVVSIISSRLDALAEDERALLQLASVLGSVFWDGALAALGWQGDAQAVLERLGEKDLVKVHARSAFAAAGEYRFKHALIRDGAYSRLPRARRRVLHALAREWIARACGERRDSFLDMLAHHAHESGEGELELGYLVDSAEVARRGAAHRTAAELLGRALAIAEQLGRREEVARLRARRGHELTMLASWDAARPDLEAAIAELPEDAAEERAGAHLRLGEVDFWALDNASGRRHAEAARDLAASAGLPGILAGALAYLAQAAQCDGDLEEAARLQIEAVRTAGGIVNTLQGSAGLPFYLLGRMDEAYQLANAAAEASEDSNDTPFRLYSLQHQGLVLGAIGRYAEAATVFARAARLGRELDALPLVARGTSMSAGTLLDACDFSGALAAAEEAKELAERFHFVPTAISAAIDVLFVHLRAGEPGGAAASIEAVGEAIETTPNWHEWLWRLRFAQARAELALASGNDDEALAASDDCLRRSRAAGRRKYESEALRVRASALARMGRREEAQRALQGSYEAALATASPALVLRASADVLGSGLWPEADEAVASEAAAALDTVRSGLAGGAGLSSFERSPLVGRLADSGVS